MDFFKQAIECLPENWREEHYKDKTYVLVKLEEDSEEYREVLGYCKENGHNSVTGIERIQHPFAYLRFRLQEELQDSTPVYRRREVVRVAEEELDLYIKHNCDPRRIKSFGSQSLKYVIKKSVHVISFPERDVNWYPEYVIEISQEQEKQEDSQKLTSANSLLSLLL